MAGRHLRGLMIGGITMALVAPGATVYADSTAPSDRADQYWGLPNIVGSDARGFPKVITPAQTRAYVIDTATAKRLPGIHKPGVHVRRAHLPRIGRITLAKDPQSWTLNAPISGTRAIYGKQPATSLEELAVVVTVRDTRESNPSRQPILHRDVAWRAFKQDQRKLRARVSFTLPKRISRKLAAWSGARRGESITVNVVHVIDADGRRLKGRRTADHVKTASLNLATSRASTAGDGQGALLNIWNSDDTSDVWPNYPYDPANSTGSLSINLVSNPVSCMLTSGDSASDFAGLNVTGMLPGETVEGYLEAAAGSQQAANEAPASQDVLDDMEQDIGEAIVETIMGMTVTWTTVAFDGFGALIGLYLKGCSNNPSMFTMAATDSMGNASSIGYSLDAGYNDAAPGQSNPGGIADAMTAYTIWGQSIGFFSLTQQAEYLGQAFLENNYAPGPQNVSFVATPPIGTNSTITGSGGDAGLAFTAAENPQDYPLAAVGGKKDTQYPIVDFYVNWGPTCSSLLGGTFVPVFGNGGNVTNGFTYNSCEGWSNAPTAVNANGRTISAS